MVIEHCSDYAILALAAASPASSSTSGSSSLRPVAEQLFCSGIDSKITCWDLKMTARKVYAMMGHTDTVTCLAVHPEGTHLLSNAMDSTLKIWDIRPFVGTSSSSSSDGRGGSRKVKEFVGHLHSIEKGLLKCAWSPDGSMVTAGSADHLVHIWDEFTTQELYVLPGHKGCVNAVTFHPTEPNIIASGASDKLIYVGELS